MFNLEKQRIIYRIPMSADEADATRMPHEKNQACLAAFQRSEEPKPRLGLAAASVPRPMPTTTAQPVNQQIQQPAEPLTPAQNTRESPTPSPPPASAAPSPASSAPHPSPAPGPSFQPHSCTNCRNAKVRPARSVILTPLRRPNATGKLPAVGAGKRTSSVSTCR